MKNIFRKNKSRRGFTIVELSVILTVIAIAMLASLSYTSAQSERRKYAATAAELQSNQAIIERFYDLNGYIPCPAVGWLGADDVNYGVADCDNTIPNGDLRAGTLPFKTLGVSPIQYKDSYGNPENYIMDYRFADNAAFASELAGSLSVSLVDGTKFTNAIYILYSSGRNGYGAWIPGSPDHNRILTKVTNDKEVKNADFNQNDFYNIPYDTYNIRTGEVDDQMVFNTREGVVGKNDAVTEDFIDHPPGGGSGGSGGSGG